jgi:FkbM family methyltransferase
MQPLFEALYRIGLAGMNFGPSSPDMSGEANVLRALRDSWRGRELTVIDAGANSGEWAERAMQILDPALLVCIEPSTAARAQLSRRLPAAANLRIEPFALGEKDGGAVLYADEPGSGLASLHQRNLGHLGISFDVASPVRVRRLDDYCREQGITRVDLLKLDVEGCELAALRGAAELLHAAAVRVIQFEFGGTAIDARIHFRDLFDLLNPHFRIHRILRDGLAPIESYRERDEIFATANYLCVSRGTPCGADP